jgi:hypothetical protein
MRKYIRSVVLICALNGVGVWADNFYSKPCATRVISPDYGNWPALSTTWRNYCKRTRDSEICSGPVGAVGWTGYYCNDSAKRDHEERTEGALFQGGVACPHAETTIFRSDFKPTKLLSKDPCSFYNNP